jgi:transposase
MQTITTIDLDIAKSVFRVHGVDVAGQVVVRRQLKRRQVIAFFQKLPLCLVGIEVCASSHHWSRERQGLGHSVRLMPPAYVKPYVKRQKNDMADAERSRLAGSVENDPTTIWGFTKLSYSSLA